MTLAEDMTPNAAKSLHAEGCSFALLALLDL
jgi:hypothetical protein